MNVGRTRVGKFYTTSHVFFALTSVPRSWCCTVHTRSLEEHLQCSCATVVLLLHLRPKHKKMSENCLVHSQTSERDVIRHTFCPLSSRRFCTFCRTACEHTGSVVPDVKHTCGFWPASKSAIQPVCVILNLKASMA